MRVSAIESPRFHFVELVGAGADRVGGQLVDTGAGEHRPDPRRHPVEPVVARLAQGHLELGGRQRLGVLDDVHRRLQRDGPVRLDPVDAEDGVLGGELRPVGEGRVAGQVERVGLAVRADRPRRRQVRDDLAVVVELDQPVVHVAQQRLRDGGTVGPGEVEVRRLGDQADGERGALAPPLALPPLPVAVEPAEQPAAVQGRGEGEGQRAPSPYACAALSLGRASGEEPRGSLVGTSDLYCRLPLPVTGPTSGLGISGH